MKKILPNTEETRKYLSKRPTIYMVGCWARWGVRSYPLSHIQIKKNKETKEWTVMPYVWDYWDFNGLKDEYRRIPLTHTTTGAIFTWTFSEGVAHKIAELLNENYEKRVRDKLI